MSPIDHDFLVIIANAFGLIMVLILLMIGISVYLMIMVTVFNVHS